MKKNKFITGLLACSAVFFTASASAVTVMEMEGMATNQVTPYSEGGYSISAPGEHLHSVLDDAEFDGAAQMANDTEGMLLRKDDGGKFDLVNLTSLALRGSDIKPSNPGPFALQVDGIIDGSVAVSKQLMSGTTGVIDFLSENASWGGLDEVHFWYESAGGFGHPSTFVGDDFKFDALTVQAASTSAVPVPAAVWLFISAVGGLGFMRKRKLA